jgi:putative DNA primase/helicase
MAKKKREPVNAHPTTPPHTPKVDDSSSGLENQKKVPEKRLIPSLDEFGIAKRLFLAHHERLRFQTDAQALLAWDGTQYSRLPHVAEGLAKDVIEKIALEHHNGDIHVTDHGADVELEDLLSFQKKARTQGMIRKALWLLRLFEEIHCKLADFNADPHAINCQNGLLNLEDGSLAPHSPDQLVTKLAPVRWNPKAKCPNWYRFIDEITSDNPELAAYLQRLFGYCLSGSTQEEVMPILYGSGANGKSIFLARMRAILGPAYALTLGTNSILNSRFHGIRCDLRQLEGARVAFAIEANNGYTLDEAVIKSVTGGDEISARAMRENPVQFTPQAKILMAVNHLPGFVGNDRGIRRRLQVVPFLAEFDGSRRKEQIDAELDAESEGILAWAVKGFQQWLQEGLNPPQIIRDATEAYFTTNDHIGEFLEERTVRVSGEKTPIRMVFDSYEQWTRASGVQSVGLHRFGDLLRSKGFVQVRDNTTRFWADLVLRTVE